MERGVHAEAVKFLHKQMLSQDRYF